MWPKPRIVAVDDDLTDLGSLVKGLNQEGFACLPIHFPGEESSDQSCPHVRVLFVDLHLIEGPTIEGENGDQAHYRTITTLIAKSIRPTGSYFIVLWSRFPDKASELFEFINQRLPSNSEVKKPFAVLPLDKIKVYRPGEEMDISAIGREISNLSSRYPAIAALFNWEDRILHASIDTVLSVLDLAPAVAEGLQEDVQLNQSAGKLLKHLAETAVGSEHVEDNRFRAVNEALLPILADRISTLHQNELDDADLWQSAWNEKDTQSELPLGQMAQLNQLLHIAVPPHDVGNGGERGAVIRLLECIEENFEARFGIQRAEAAYKQFWQKRCGEESFWVLVQSQAACDYAQKSLGALPYHLGLCLPDQEVRSDGTMPDAIWTTPPFDFHDEVHYLHVNARFPILLPRDQTESAPPVFRLREQLLDQMIYQLHGYMSRPGIVAFVESKDVKKARKKKQK